MIEPKDIVTKKKPNVLNTTESKCVLCNKIFSDNGNLKTHMFRLHSENQIKNHFCTLCPKGFVRACELKSHNRIHYKEGKRKSTAKGKQFKCQMCDYSTYNDKLLSSHTKKVHGPVVLFSCDMCEKYFQHKNSYDIHILKTSQRRKTIPMQNMHKIIFPINTLAHPQTCSSLWAKKFSVWFV